MTNLKRASLREWDSRPDQLGADFPTLCSEEQMGAKIKGGAKDSSSLRPSTFLCRKALQRLYTVPSRSTYSFYFTDVPESFHNQGSKTQVFEPNDPSSSASLASRTPVLTLPTMTDASRLLAGQHMAREASPAPNVG